MIQPMAWVTLKDSMMVCKRSQSQNVYSARLYLFIALYSGEGNSTRTENRPLVARGWGGGGFDHKGLVCRTILSRIPVVMVST